MKNDEHRWDELIDRALADYTSPVPPLGLEARVLRRIRAGGAAERWSLWPWMVVAAACCLLAGVAVWILRAPAPAPPRIVVSKMVPQPHGETSKLPIRTIQRRQKRLPARAPLTREERALVAFVKSAPEQALRSFGPMQPIEIAPLSIDKIEVQPLPDHPSEQ